ncbi:hypothetical protein E4U55_007936 [Claviceps digitariae]|nr:hypothetical protein E4U55_007936 [Claviceps digitariae]
MKPLLSTVSTVLSLTALAHGHMQMSNPPPLLSKFNKFTTSQDYDMVSPLHADGGNFPCKGHQRVLGTPQGQPVAQWTPGKSYSMTITGGAAHDGGSCQASLSFDKGASWKVIHSYIGNCPLQGESSFDFVLPADTPAGTMLFAWTWFNKVGNREMYMNCAVIDVQGGGGSGDKKQKKRGTAAALSKRPAMFVANVGNGCGTADGKDVMFPDPGPEVDLQSGSSAPPTGKCAAALSLSPPDTPAAPSAPAAPSSSPPPPSPTPPSSSSSPPASSPSPSSSGGPKTISPVPAPLPSSKPLPVANTTTTTNGTSPCPAMSPPTPSGSCKPGSFECTNSTSGDGWKVCNTSRTWVFAGTCPPNQVNSNKCLQTHCTSAKFSPLPEMLVSPESIHNPSRPPFRDIPSHDTPPYTNPRILNVGSGRAFYYQRGAFGDSLTTAQDGKSR